MFKKNNFDSNNYYGNSNPYTSNDNFVNNSYGNNNYGNNNYGNNSYNNSYNNYSSRPNRYQNKGNNNSKIMIKLIIAAILVIIVIIGLILLFSSGGENANDNSSNENTNKIAVQLFDTNLTLTVGEQRKLQYSISNNGNSSLLKFSSSDASIVSVDSEGNINAIAAGSATISITYDGENGQDIKSCNITVNNIETSNTNTSTSTSTNTTPSTRVNIAKTTPIIIVHFFREPSLVLPLFFS